MAYGALAALDDRPRPGKEPTITPEAKAWLYLWPATRPRSTAIRMNCGRYGFWPAMARERGPAAGHQCLARPGSRHRVQASPVKRKSSRTRCATIWNAATPSFRAQDGGSSCVSTARVQVLKKAAAGAEKSKKPVAIVSYDEKPGIQAIATTAPDLPPVPGRHASFARDHEYKRHGTLSLLAGIDLLTGKVHALVRSATAAASSSNSSSFSMPPIRPAPRSSFDPRQSFRTHFEGNSEPGSNTRPPGRFDFTFTPKHGSWLQPDRGLLLLSSPAPSCAISGRDFQARTQAISIMAAIDDVNRHPVVHHMVLQARRGRLI